MNHHPFCVAALLGLLSSCSVLQTIEDNEERSIRNQRRADENTRDIGRNAGLINANAQRIETVYGYVNGHVVEVQRMRRGIEELTSIVADHAAAVGILSDLAIRDADKASEAHEELAKLLQLYIPGEEHTQDRADIHHSIYRSAARGLN